MTSVAEKTQVVMIGEFGTDVDEAIAIVLACQAMRDGDMDLLSFVGNHVEAEYRARNAKRTLTALGQGDVPVGMGERGFGTSSTECEKDPQFLSHPAKIGLGRDVLKWTLQHAEDNSIVLALNSGFTDAVWLWMDDSALFLQKVRRVVIMGGIEMDGDHPKLSHQGFLVPAIGKNGAANNNFDEGSTLHLYHLVQKHGIPTIITTRHASYGCRVSFEVFEEMAHTGSPIGQRLAAIQYDRLRELWAKANAPVGHPLRGDLPARCDRSWFTKTFCDGSDPGEDDIVGCLAAVAWYDPLNMIAGIDSLHGRFFDPYNIEVNGTTHQVIGLTEADHGLRDPDALLQYMRQGVLRALRLGQTPLPLF